MRNIGYMGDNSLKNKWLTLLEKSRLGLLKVASENPHNDQANYQQMDQ